MNITHRMALLRGSLAAATLALASCATLGDGKRQEQPGAWTPKRVVTADVVAINQPLVYNRFGSLNPWGMVYALRGDLADPAAGPGEARLKPERRPRPLVLRVAEGDELRIRFQNLLADVQWVDGQAVCDSGAEGGEAEANSIKDFTLPHPPNDPCNRRAGIAVVGLAPIDGNDPVQTGLVSPAPGDAAVEYRYKAQKAGSYFFSSLAAIAGGEGNGGSLTHGLFGMVIVEPAGSRYYRSQVLKADLDCARDPANGGPGCQSAPGAAWLDYEASRDGKPLLNMLRASDDGSYEIVHGDLTAIVVESGAASRVGQPASDQSRAGASAWREFTIVFHDELKTVHHPDFDVLNTPSEGASKAAQARHSQMVGTRDGFGINYGASGMGTVLIANRLGKGPARDCVDCAYEEFFLGSWANGDPALLEQYGDDPSNVYHSYLGDRVKFHNVHAGPKETHVFHLHAHQWLSQASEAPATPGGPFRASKGDYLDSQTIAPFQSFNYEIYYGGTGNRNLTPGDSIFHCHLYPHFAQGMWALWRVHEVLEDGARKLPDGGGAWTFDRGAGWRYDPRAYAGPGTDRDTGLHGAGTPIPALVPLPGQALPPEPTYANSPPVLQADGSRAPVMPGYPFYIAGKAGYRAPQPPRDLFEDAGLPRHVTEKPDGCPAGINGCARIVPTLAQALDAGDMTYEIKKVKVTVLPNGGDAYERAAMNWHAGLPADANPWDQDVLQRLEALKASKPATTPVTLEEPEEPDARPTRGYQPSLLVDRYREGVAAPFLVNGLRAAPGAPFANPCPLKQDEADHWVPGLSSLATGTRLYEVSAVELQLLVNQYGWHDKQARINVLSKHADGYSLRAPPRAADPFFFRAHSGECIEFLHTNRTRDKTGKDAFQVATPTDVIGQHIHLVKFDVTSSDGSANGYNYEDGTLARDHIEHIIHASKVPGGSAVRADTGEPVALEAKTAGGKPVYQTSIQRWWADPLLDSERQDRTIATVFTHDHFGPSTIQQHGFYSALLIEPPGTVWKRPDGRPLEDGVGTQAIIEVPEGVDTHGMSENLRVTRREFALAVADFALLYDRNDRPIAPPHGDPTRPEAISVDHHDPYLFNYRNEPVPLRIGSSESRSHWAQYDSDDARNGERGDPANLFSSVVHAFQSPHKDHKGRCAADSNTLGKDDREYCRRANNLATLDTRENHAWGDPSTEIFEAYEGDPVQVRLIQGAQEVQHTFTLHGQRWRRLSANDASTWVSAQEVGISEHFEMHMQAQPSTKGNVEWLTSDFLYHAGSVDALWNGAWGLFRTYADPARSFDRSRLADDDTPTPVRCRLAALDKPVAGEADPDCPDVPAPATAAKDIMPLRLAGLPAGNAFRPDRTVDARLFCIEAIDEPIDYNARLKISDPAAARFVLVAQGTFTMEPDGSGAPSCEDLGEEATGNRLVLPNALVEQGRLVPLPVPDDAQAPLVLRMRSGEMAHVNVLHRLEAPLGRTRGNAVLPPIVSRREDGVSLNDSLTPSSIVGLHASTVSYQVHESDGVNVGFNNAEEPDPGNTEPMPNPSETAAGGMPATVSWYAGHVATRRSESVLELEWIPFATETGMVATLSSMTDPIRHPVAGLVGALVIEPADAELDQAYLDGQVRPGGTQARLCRGSGSRRECWDEMVLVYQDGLNLKHEEALHTIPDCHVCDDSYDSGDTGLNYRTEPFWARLGLPREVPGENAGDPPTLVDLNNHYPPADYLLPTREHPVATPTFCTAPGERVVVHAVHPGGRARQRSFISYGNRYDDLSMPRFGSPSSSLLAPQKAATMDLGRINEGLWLYRDGTAFLMAGGAWGYIDARASKPDGACAAAP
ncbi:hypothetical protein [Pseudoxanthomonas putridarboris]|uniref:Multicopper oxidase n=1 Tax=Pseudoxanthomonas putridarboris TaxID=752605 RepID=A0ABU9IZU0_9GAMM